MRPFSKVVRLAFAALITSGLASFALADEVTTTTTTRETKPAPGVTIGVPGVAGVQIGGGQTNCVTRHQTMTNEDTGTSVSKTQRKCD